MKYMAYVLGRDNKQIGYKIGGLMGYKIKDGLLNIQGKRFILRSERFYLRPYTPVSHYLAVFGVFAVFLLAGLITLSVAVTAIGTIVSPILFFILRMKKDYIIAIDYRYDSPEAILKHDMPSRIMTVEVKDKETGEMKTEEVMVPVAIPGQLSPEGLGAYFDTWVLKDFHKKSMDWKIILILCLGAAVVVMALTGLR